MVQKEKVKRYLVSVQVLMAVLVEAKQRSVKEKKIQAITYLRQRNTTGKELDKISSLENHIRIIGLASSLDGHGTLDQIQNTGDADLVKGTGDMSPDLLKIVLSVFGEECCKGRLFCEWCGVVLGLELFHLPVVDIVRVPGCNKYRVKERNRLVRADKLMSDAW